MKVRSAREVPQANKIFTDREEPRKTFWKHYNVVKSQLSDIADIKVISYYGIGGVGKSTLIRKPITIPSLSLISECIPMPAKSEKVSNRLK